MRTEITLGSVALSMAISLKDRCSPGLKSSFSGAVNSPDRRKPKNPKQQAAHSMTWSPSDGSWFQTWSIFFRMHGVIGRGVCLGIADYSFLDPRTASSNNGILSTAPLDHLHHMTLGGDGLQISSIWLSDISDLAWTSTQQSLAVFVPTPGEGVCYTSDKSPDTSSFLLCMCAA